jgi:CBS domain-containing protein
MTVGDVMTEQVATCLPETNLAAVAALFWENDCGAIPVIDARGNIAGILTDRHMCIAVGTRDSRPSELTAGDVMEDAVVTCNATDHIRAAVHTMREAKVRRLPVVSKQGALAGLVSIDDILMNVQRDHGNADAISYAEMLHSLQAIVSRVDRPDKQAAAA